MAVEIELGLPKDVDEVEKMYDDLNDALESGVNYPGWKKGAYPARKEAQNGIGSGALFVAKMDGKIVGSVILNHLQEKEYDEISWGYSGAASTILVVHTLVVHPAYSKLGIGRALLQFAEIFAKENSVEDIRLDVYENNLPAISLYERCGYVRMGKLDFGYENIGLKWFFAYEKVLVNS